MERRSDHSIYLKWRGVSTTNEEEPLEGYKVALYITLNVVFGFTHFELLISEVRRLPVLVPLRFIFSFYRASCF